MNNGSYLILLLGITLSLFCCRNKTFSEQVKAFPETELTKHWVLRLPPDMQKTSIKDKLFQNVFGFSNDSMIMKLSTDTVNLEEALSNYNTIIKNERENTAEGPCLGNFTGYAKFHNFLDTVNGLSGTILDLEDNGKRTVSFRVEDFSTGNRLDLAFESLSSERKDLIHAIVKNVRYKP